MKNITNIIIRDANKNDLATIQNIYAYHVSFGLASFEEVPPDIKEISRRLNMAKEQNLPYLVAEYNGEIQGFSYVSPFRKRIAYRYVVEDSVYVSENILRLRSFYKKLDTDILIPTMMKLGKLEITHECQFEKFNNMVIITE